MFAMYFFLFLRLPPGSTLTATLFPCTPLFRADVAVGEVEARHAHRGDRLGGAGLDALELAVDKLQQNPVLAGRAQRFDGKESGESLGERRDQDQDRDRRAGAGLHLDRVERQIGRESCRARVGKKGETTGGAETLKKKQK